MTDIAINLIDWRGEAVRRRQQRRDRRLLLAMAVVVLALGGWRLALQAPLTDARQTLAEARRQLATATAEATALQALADEHAWLRQQLAAIVSLRAQQQESLQLLEHLVAARPATLQLTAIRHQAGQLQLEGRAGTAEAITGLASALAVGGPLHDVRLLSMEQDATATRFTLLARPGAPPGAQP